MTGTAEPGPAGEWLLVNGLGGYALGPRDGPPRRGYHGWLVAATHPPDGRVLLAGAIETMLSKGDAAWRLDELELCPGRAVRDGIAVSLSAVMPRDVNATILTWRREDALPGEVEIRLAPRVAGRDHHPSGGTCAEPSAVAIAGDGKSAAIAWADATVPDLEIAIDHGSIHDVRRAVPVHYAEEEARGTAPDEVLHVTVEIRARLIPESPLTMVIGTTAGSRSPLPRPAGAADVTSRAPARAAELVRRSGHPALGPLVLAADRFIVRRPDPALADPDEGVTVIAGYPWFGDWGRDTMISLPGLALATGRHDVAERILRTWAGLVRDGLLPNHFPDAGGGEPAYHAIDAPLWFVHALGAAERASGTNRLALELRAAVEQIITAYRDGTRFGIGVDPADGLVRGGEPGLQLTWMDAKVDGTVITPRHGKPVEIQALWIEALRLASTWAQATGDIDAGRRHAAFAAQATDAFRARFLRPDRGWLADVVDGPDGDDVSLRPNQLLALSLLDDLVDPTRAEVVLDAVEQHLLVPGGVRTLAPFEPGYRDRFQGPPATRDAAYHQGPAWTWLLGPWIDAVARHRGTAAARTELDRALMALDPGGTGAIPELLEPEAPFARRGCPWQAWGVAELLRCAAALEDA